MSEERKLVQAICAEPDDDTPRLALADWLDENATTVIDPKRCSGKHRHDGRRESVIHGAFHEGTPQEYHHHHDEKCYRSDGRAERAAFVRTQIKIAELEEFLAQDWSKYAECTGASAGWCPVCGDCTCVDREESSSDAHCPLHSPTSPHTGDKDPFLRHLEALREREAELFDPAWLPPCMNQQREWYFSCFPTGHTPSRPFSFVVRRGFAEILKVLTVDFLGRPDYTRQTSDGHPLKGVFMHNFGFHHTAPITGQLTPRPIIKFSEQQTLVTMFTIDSVGRDYPWPRHRLPTQVRRFLTQNPFESLDDGSLVYPTYLNAIVALAEGLAAYARSLTMENPCPP